VVITGRRARDVVGLLGLDPQPEIWGSHGLQRLLPDGTCQMPTVDQAATQGLSNAAGWLETLHLRHLAELKPGGIAVHWRGVSEARAVEIRDQVLRGWFPIAQKALLSLLEFDGGVEMRLSDFDKGDAVRVLLEEIGSEGPVAYLGDDMTDEHAFEALASRGLTFLVRPQWRQTAARLWLKPPHELLDFLERWSQACGRRHRPVGDDRQLQPMDGR
jgi:trehalose 6-phosphate phosphatase